MKIGSSLPLSLAASFLVCFTPLPSGAQGAKAQPPDPPSMGPKTSLNTQSAEQVEAAKQMVPAEVKLTSTLDARKDQPGSTFEAKLDGTVHLKDGTELPHGTVLMGKVVTDKMQSSGTSRLALRFTEAKLKDGKTVPIEATIVGISGPAGDYTAGGVTGPIPWDGTSVQYDNIGVISHVDLHSRIGGMNSGTLVANDKSDMKLTTGSRFSLALGQKGTS
ncbi:MAG TPA: hypothetical protein VME23_19225 [Terracidiphilus sp.]|jgi:hypothetical protein|nr:hypothetical protein [Terracidiphilus sp.]